MTGPEHFPEEEIKVPVPVARVGDGEMKEHLPPMWSREETTIPCLHISAKIRLFNPLSSVSGIPGQVERKLTTFRATGNGDSRSGKNPIYRARECALSMCCRMRYLYFAVLCSLKVIHALSA
ncbi:MAG TPA: hypothetical protein PK069_09935 [Methanolinea sp.]|nr:hypothetical protein [Methanolinea sp.]HQK56829.1 hypothetical protein [Methanolinea sp.]